MSKKTQSNFNDFNPPSWRGTDSPFAPSRSWDWVNVVYLLSHFCGEFLIRGDNLIAMGPKDAQDIAILRWLVNTIRSTRERHLRSIQGQSAEAAGKQAYQDPQERMWLLAGACYVLVLASFDRPGITTGATASPSGSDTGTGVNEYARREVKRLHDWWEEKVTEWLQVQTLPWESICFEMLENVAWLTTPEGEMIIEQLYRDTVARLGGQWSDLNRQVFYLPEPPEQAGEI